MSYRPLTSATEKITSTRLKPIGKEFEGAWEGGISAALPMVVRLSNGPDGLATGTFVSINQGNVEVPIGAVVQNGARLRLILPTIRGTFDAELKDHQLTGVWSQGRPVPLVLKRPK